MLSWLPKEIVESCLLLSGAGIQDQQLQQGEEAERKQLARDSGVVPVKRREVFPTNVKYTPLEKQVIAVKVGHFLSVRRWHSCSSMYYSDDRKENGKAWHISWLLRSITDLCVVLFLSLHCRKRIPM